MEYLIHSTAFSCKKQGILKNLPYFKPNFARLFFEISKYQDIKKDALQNSLLQCALYTKKNSFPVPEKCPKRTALPTVLHACSPARAKQLFPSLVTQFGGHRPYSDSPCLLFSFQDLSQPGVKPVQILDNQPFQCQIVHHKYSVSQNQQHYRANGA